MYKKTAIITGASRGIGKGIAEEFAKAEYDLALISRNKKELEAIIHDIKGIPPDFCEQWYKKDNSGLYLAYECDVSDKSQVENIFKAISKDFNSIDVLVNNAGINSRKNLNPKGKNWLESFDENFKGWGEEIETNLTGTFICSYIAASFMIAQSSGSIINISSVKGIEPTTSPGYGASKAGIIKLTKDFARALAIYGIRVNCIAPGFIESGMTTELPEEKRKAYMELIPQKRFGRVEEVAKVALFLASKDSSYITGETIQVNGGYLMR